MVIVSEPSPKRREMARQLGADVVVDPREADLVGVVREITSDQMADVVYECSGIPAAFLHGLSLLRRFGKMIQVAGFEKSFEIGPEQMNLITLGNLSLRGCAGVSWPRAFELAMSERVKTRELVSHVFKLENIEEAFAAQLNALESIKVVVTP